jgi:hypothetical protein
VGLAQAGEPGGEAESLWEGRGGAREARRGGWRLTAGGGAGDDECVKVWRLVRRWRAAGRRAGGGARGARWPKYNTAPLFASFAAAAIVWCSGASDAIDMPRPAGPPGGGGEGGARPRGRAAKL